LRQEVVADESLMTLKFKVYEMEMMRFIVVLHVMMNVFIRGLTVLCAINIDRGSVKFKGEIVAHARFYS
jgi:hypothetical protein